MIYLHIGRHKTGTSALQRLLAGNRRRLARRGIICTRSLRGLNVHHDLANALNPAWRARADAEAIAQADAEIAHMRAVLAEPGDKIVSSEAFQNADPALVGALFPPEQTTVVVYLREQLDYLLSAYPQLIQAQTARPAFITYAIRFRADYAEFLDGWSAIFGRESIRARVYDPRFLVEGDVRRDFLEVIGASARRLEFASRPINPTIGPQLIEFKGVLNALLPAELHRKLRIYHLLGRLAQRDPSRLAVPADFAASFRRRFEASNARLEAQYLPDGLPARAPSGLLQFPSPAEACEASLSKVAEMLPHIAATLRRQLPETLGAAAPKPLLPGDWAAAQAAL